MWRVLLRVGLFLLTTSLLGAADRAGRVALEAAGATTNRGGAGSNDTVEAEFQRLLRMDDAARADADEWIVESRKFAELGQGESPTLTGRLRQRLEPVRRAYEDFLRRQPQHVRARLAFGGFLNETGEEEAAAEQWRRASEIDPRQPSVWNNLGNYYGRNGPVTNSFACFQKALELDPKQPLYHHHFAKSLCLFFREATNHFRLTGEQLLNRALAHYTRARALDPYNFALATDLAQTYYGVQPPRPKDALEAWDHALRLAGDDLEREGVQLHVARWEIFAGRPDDARLTLTQVTNTLFTTVKKQILDSLDRPVNSATNAAPAPGARAGNR